MDIQKYIESGILENYVLGQVSKEKAEEVEKNIVQYPALKTELDKIEDALEQYAQAKAMPIPAGLSAQIMQSIEKLDSTPSPTSDAAPTNPKPQAISPKSNNILSILLGIGLLGALLGSFFLYQQKQEFQNQLVQSQAQVNDINDRMATLQLDCDQKDGTIQRLQEQIAIIKNPAYRPVSMNGTPNAPTNTQAIVYYNPAAAETRLDVGNLPTPPSDRDYQLWAIVDGQPTDMGVFDLATARGGLEVMTHIGNAQAFAITLEPRDGNPAPNLDELFVIGNV